ncbi:MAG: hypothetical protein R3B70_15595 [Polyangiaceae bacterium]
MSHSQVQAALALLIRLPEHHRGAELDAFVARFALDPEEERTVRALAADPRVVKYGRSMAGVRGEVLRSQLRLSLRFLSPEVLDCLHRGLFEPDAVDVRFGDLSTRFLEFLITDPRARRVLSREAPPFLTDILRLEREQMRFRQELSVERWPAPPGSRLVHTAFRIVSLDYDIPRLMEALSAPVGDEGEEGEEPELLVVARRVTVLLVPHPSLPASRMFDIDAETVAFLRTEASGRRASRVPDTAPVLVEMGLLREGV